MSDECTRPTAAGCACATPSRSVANESIESLRATIRGLQDELIACQRLALLGNMAAMVTHEFNNLLTPIMARAEAALTGDDVPFMRKTLERALIQSQRAMSVTRHLLDMVHNDACPAEACSVAAAVHEAIETMTRPLEKDGIQLHVAVPDDLRVNARNDLLCQVLLNLLLNARRAMKDGGGPLTVAATAVDGQVQIEVRDSGSGISAETLDQVLNPFLAADPRERPTDWQQVGLGLSVCRMIARHHGATLQAFANDGSRGCTFRLVWPAAGTPAGRSRGTC